MHIQVPRGVPAHACVGTHIHAHSHKSIGHSSPEMGCDLCMDLKKPSQGEPSY